VSIDAGAAGGLIFMTKQCVKRCGRRVAPSFSSSTQLAQEQDKKKIKIKNKIKKLQ
jgi:hypothetical protein